MNMEFKITYEIKGQLRKELVQAISDYLKTIPKYLSVPTCAYEIGELTVDRAEGQYKLSTPKTKSSLRVIAIPAELKVILKDHKAWQEKRSEELGSKWKDRGAVVTGMEGEYMSGGYLNITLKKLLKKHDLPDIHVHDLRHANASLLINAGVPVKFIFRASWTFQYQDYRRYLCPCL